MKMAFFTPMHKSVFFSPLVQRLKTVIKKDLDICLAVLAFLPMQNFAAFAKSLMGRIC